MINSGERGLAVILDIITDSRLFTPDQIRVIEDYFDGRTDDAGLGKLEERNLSTMAMALMAELCWLIRNGMDED